MKANVAVAAKNLLELERLAQGRSLTDEEFARWLELARCIFGRDDTWVHNRRSFRLPTRASGFVRTRDIAFECSFAEISQINVTLVGDKLRTAQKGDIIVLESILSDPNETVPLDLRCEIKRVIITDKSVTVGAEILISEHNSAFTLQNFLDKVYYRFYFQFLEGVVATPCQLASSE